MQGALQTAERDGACPNILFPPRPGATPAELEQAQATELVHPLYSSAPAPIGLADYGLSENASGDLVGSELSTSSVLGIADFNATGVEPMDLYNMELGPDAYSLQLNAVVPNVTLFGHSGYEFWTQNVFEYFPSLHFAYLITNVWNFSDPYYFGPALYSHGPHGQLYGYVYAASVGFSHVTYPFNLSLYLNSTLTDGRDAVYFTGVLKGPGESINAPFDYVVFNSTKLGAPPLTEAAEYQASGTHYDPLGLTNDFELDFGGPGDGSQATLIAGDAQLGLAYWNSSAHGGLGGYVSVPAAYNYGGETGETSTGATVTWSDAPGGPDGLSTYASMASGPTILSGLWNLSEPEGAEPVTLQASPTNAFEVLTPVTAPGPWKNLTSSLSASPPPLSEVAEAYDPALKETVVFGGWSATENTGTDSTWIFANGTWSLYPAALSPPARWGASMAYDAADGYLLLFGGRTNIGPALVLNDTWIFDGTGWHQLSPAVHPAGRGFASMAYDAALGEVVLFGGGSGTGSTNWTMDRDTWTFAGGAWTNITSTAGAPPPRLKAGMAYDATDGQLLLVGGQTNGNYDYQCTFSLPDEWTFAAGTWSKLTPTGTVPPAGSGSLWFDSATSTTYYYEGLQNLSTGPTDDEACQTPSGNVYAYHAGAWSLVFEAGSAAGPAPRILTTVVDDVAAHEEILFGGQLGQDGPFYGDTWVFNPNATVRGPHPVVVSKPELGPTVTTETFWLAPGNYSLDTSLSGYDPVVTALNVTGPITLSLPLTANRSQGIYTPLWAWSNAGLAGLSTAGVGSPADPYALLAGPLHPIAPVFGERNDYDYPTYPGMLLLDTTASVIVVPPTIGTGGGAGLDSAESMPLWFWNVSGVALANGTHVGADQYPLSVLSPFYAIFYDSRHNLIANNTFEAPEASLLFATGPQGARYTGPGGENTVWGNRFGNGYIDGVMGVVEVEGQDLIYNNAFHTDYTACSPGNVSQPNYCWPEYPGLNASFSDTWNISRQPASTVHYAAGFPTFPLSGNIIGGKGQGGNWWWNYGTPPNTFGVLPYDEKIPYYPTFAYITPGGDYAPLFLASTVTFEEFGLPSSVLASEGWTVGFNGTTSSAKTQLGPAITVPPGIYPVVITGPRGYSAVYEPTVTVTDSNLYFIVQFSKGRTYSLSLSEKGLPAGQEWCVSLGGAPSCAAGKVVKFTGLSPGFYDASITKPRSGANVSATSRGSPIDLASFDLTRSAKLVVSFEYSVVFFEFGLTYNGTWYVSLNGVIHGAAAGQDMVFSEINGTYTYRVGKIPGFTTTGSHRFRVAGATTVVVTFRRTSSGLRPTVVASDTGIAGPARGVRAGGHLGAVPAGALALGLGCLGLAGGAARRRGSP